MKVLLVEDNNINRRVASAVLEKLGIKHIDVAHDGLQACEQFFSNQYDLVLMDCEMPVMDGFEATKKIRQWEQAHQRHPSVIIAATARTMAEDKEKCLASGMTDFVAKPIQPELLARCISKYLSELDIGPVSNSEVDTPVMPEPVSQTVDEQRFHVMCSLLNDRRDDFYQDYFNDTAEKFAQLQDPSLDADTVARQVHSIKGSAGNVGAEQLRVLAADLEQRLPLADQQSLREEGRKLEQAFTDFRTDITVRLKQLKAVN